MDPKAVEKHIKNNNGTALLRQIRDLLAPITDWSKAGLHDAHEHILALGTQQGAKRGAAAQPLRVALSGNSVTPPMLETLALLGREKTLARIDAQLSS
jgi:glutamyl-tRNA synthetase